MLWVNCMSRQAPTAIEKGSVHYLLKSGGLVVMAVICVMITKAYGQDQVLKPLSFSEDLRSNAIVVGETLRGIDAGSVVGLANLNALSITLPQGDKSRLCIEVETQDGRYFAEATYDISGTRATQRYHVDLPTRHRQFLESQPIRDIAVLAYVSSGCERKEKLYLPVQWHAEEGVRSQLTFLVNVRAPNVDARIYHREAKRYFRCNRDTESERRVAFDTECILDVNPGRRTATLVLVQNRFEHRLKDIEIKTYLP